MPNILIYYNFCNTSSPGIPFKYASYQLKVALLGYLQIDCVYNETNKYKYKNCLLSVAQKGHG